MADKNNPNLGIWSAVDKTYVGLADDNFLGQEGSFVYSENIDNFNNPKGLQLSRKVETIFSIAQTNPRRYLLTSFGVDMVFFDKYIYAEGNLIYTFTGSEVFRNAIEFGRYIVVCFTTGTSSLYTPGNTTYNESSDDEDIELQECGYLLIFNNVAMPITPTIKDDSDYRFYGTTASIELLQPGDGSIYIAAGAIIYKITYIDLISIPANPWGPFNTTANPTYSNPPATALVYGQQVQNITNFLDQFRFYVNTVNTEINQSYLFIFNRSSIKVTLSQQIDLKDMYIRGVVNDGEQDWVIAGSDDINSELYLVSGTQKVNINKERPITNQAFRYITNMIYRADYTLFKGFFVGLVNLIDGTLITTTGKRYNGYPIETNGWTKGDAFTLLSKKNNYLVVGTPAGLIQQIYMGNSTPLIKYNSTGNLISRRFYGKHVGNVKDTEILQFGYELPANTTITVQLSFNGGAFTTIRTLSGAQDQAKKYCVIYKNSINKSITTEWNYVQVKLILSTSNENVTPVVYDGMMLFTEGLRDTLGE